MPDDNERVTDRIQRAAKRGSFKSFTFKFIPSANNIECPGIIFNQIENSAGIFVFNAWILLGEAQFTN